MYAPVKALFPPDDPAGITLSTLNRTVLDNGLCDNPSVYVIRLKCIQTFYSFPWSLDAETNCLVKYVAALSSPLSLTSFLRAKTQHFNIKINCK